MLAGPPESAEPLEPRQGFPRQKTPPMKAAHFGETFPQLGPKHPRTRAKAADKRPATQPQRAEIDSQVTASLRPRGPRASLRSVPPSGELRHLADAPRPGLVSPSARRFEPVAISRKSHLGAPSSLEVVPGIPPAYL